MAGTFWVGRWSGLFTPLRFLHRASTKRNGGDNKIPKGSNGEAFESRTAGADAVVEVEKGPKSWMPSTGVCTRVYEKTESQNGLIREAVGSGRGCVGSGPGRVRRGWTIRTTPLKQPRDERRRTRCQRLALSCGTSKAASQRRPAMKVSSSDRAAPWDAAPDVHIYRGACTCKSWLKEPTRAMGVKMMSRARRRCKPGRNAQMLGCQHEAGIDTCALPRRHMPEQVPGEEPGLCQIAGRRHG